MIILSRKIDGLAAWISRHASSANNVGVVFKALDMLFILYTVYIKNNKGP